MSEYTNSTQFIDLKAQQEIIRSEINAAISKVLDHGNYIMGPEVVEFEEKLKLFTQANYAYTCANGTDALTVSMMALGLEANDAVFIPSFTYVASAETVAQLGATPFFVDVCEDTFNIDPRSLEQAIIDAKKIGLNPKIIMPVDLFGQPANLDELLPIANNNKLKVLIDGAQSFGASYNEKMVGSMGDITTTSFFPAKPLGCYGDGGAIFTQNEELAEKINSIRLHGRGDQKYDNVRIGVNSRLDTIQAAILIEKLKIFPKEIELRNHFADLYTKELYKHIKTPVVLSNARSVWAQYTLISDNRDKIRSALSDHAVPSVIYYPKALSQQDGYSHFPTVSSGLKNSEILPSKVFSLPMHPYLKDDFSSYVASIIIKNI
jgi:dTDP-4-amino-4,6-dideoxygalactose transaminase